MSDYFNPDGTIDDSSDTRTIIMRFATKEDFDKFVANSGLSIVQSTQEVTLPMSRGLSDLFDI